MGLISNMIDRYYLEKAKEKADKPTLSKERIKKNPLFWEIVDYVLANKPPVIVLGPGLYRSSSFTVLFSEVSTIDRISTEPSSMYKCLEDYWSDYTHSILGVGVNKFRFSNYGYPNLNENDARSFYLCMKDEILGYDAFERLIKIREPWNDDYREIERPTFILVRKGVQFPFTRSELRKQW